MGKYIEIIESKIVVHIQFKTRTHALFFTHQPEHCGFDTARIMGLDTKHFSGEHVLRHFIIQGMVKHPNVPLQELMKVQGHSVSAHLANMSSDFVTEGKKIVGFLH